MSEAQVQSKRVNNRGRGIAQAATSPEQAAEDAAMLAQAEAAAEERQQENERRKAEAAQVAPASGRTSRANPRDNAEYLDEDGNQLRRKVSRNQNAYEFPDRLKKKGWDYQWWPIRVMGEPMDPSSLVEVREGGWRPVPAKDMPDLVPPGWDKPHVERGGQVLYMRPMHLTQEARAEDLKIAEDQRYDKLKGALAGPQELSKIAPRRIEQIEITGHVGNLDPKQ